MCPKTVILDRMHAWMQIRGVPPLFRKEGIVKDMAARIGEVQSVDLYAMGASDPRDEHETPAGDGHRGGNSGKGDTSSRKRPQGDSTAVKPPGAKGPAPGMPTITAGSGQEGKDHGNGVKKNLDVALQEEAAKNNIGGSSSVKPDPKRPRKNRDGTEQAGSEEHRQDQ
ncbi:hypothetical protein QYE76_000215 [Lolium multiflorum]|uniref:Uncharacterized protein n=1 Tax=Lolium multiflorum TaxID=4521 RepID=A0AAD8RJM8_LOLMU|nr:hypothetical protein QYE76_000215 [Lolium multiflorum]